MIYIIRHGQTEQNYRRLLTGRRDYRLNETGIRQAQEAGEWFRSRGIHFDLVYSSPLGRAVHTAKLAAPETELRIDERLIEMEFGPYEGMDLTHPAPEVMTFFRDFEHNPAPEGMEALDQITERLGGFLEWLKPEAAEKNIRPSRTARSILASWSTGHTRNRCRSDNSLYRSERSEHGALK